MASGRHRVQIELDASGGPPSGLIRIDGGGERSFCGWIHLMAQLEALMPDTWVEGGVDQIGDGVQDHDEEGPVERDGHDGREVQLLE
jgi:hypothetical protein